MTDTLLDMSYMDEFHVSFLDGPSHRCLYIHEAESRYPNTRYVYYQEADDNDVMQEAIHVGRYDPEAQYFILMPVTDDEEWEYACSLWQTYLKEALDSTLKEFEDEDGELPFY